MQQLQAKRWLPPNSATEMFARKAVTNETTAASRITDFSKPNLFTIPTLTPFD